MPPRERAKPGHHRCPRHQIEYEALKQCPICFPTEPGVKPDPGPPPAEKKLKLPKPPKGCVSAAEREAWFVKLANETLKDVARLAKGLTTAGGKSSDEDDSTWHTENAIKAHRDTAIKAMRAAHELGAAREEAELVEERRRANVAEAR
jgi:hypothetical protein